MSSSETASIKIVNNFIDVLPFAGLLTGEGGWSYSKYPGLLGDSRPSWHVHLCGSKEPREKALHDNVLHATPGLEPLNDLWQSIKEELAPDYGLVRAYANGHTCGLEGIVHRYAKPSDQELVALLYINREWNDDWAGETVFYDAARECISIRPRPGRLLLFDGSITRVSRPPSGDCPTLCMTLSLHLRRVPR